MNEQHFTNNFYVSGNNNSVNFEQHIDARSDGAEMMGMVLKFLVTILLSPIMIPLLLAANGVKMIQQERQGGDYDA